MISPWGEVTFSYGIGEYRSTNEFPSNDKYKIEDYGFLQVISTGTHPGDDSNQDEISLSGPWINNGQWFEANLNGDEFSDLIYVGNSIGTREYVPEDLMITFINDGNGHFQIAPELFPDNTFPCVQGGTNWLNTDSNDSRKKCGNQQDYTTGKIVADFNGDGISDYYDTSILYLSNQGVLENKSLTNLPDLFFQEGHGQIFVHDATHGDLDGDGDVDIFAPIFDSTQTGYLFGGEKDTCSSCNETIPFTALINDGSGYFSANHNFPNFEWLEVGYDNHGVNIDKLWPTTATIADFDNDGFGDVAFGWFNPRIAALYGFSENSSGAVYLNNGSNDWTQKGFIELPSNYFGANGNANDMEAFDFDGDGYIDIILASTIHDPYYESRTIQFFKNINGQSFNDVTEEKYPDYLTYADGNPFSNYWIGQGKLKIVDYDHDGDLDIVDSVTRTYVLLNNGDFFDFYDNFVDADDDRILWPIEIDGKYHYDFIGSNVDCKADSCTTNFFQVLDPINQDLLKNFLYKGDVYSDRMNLSLNRYGQVRKASRKNQFIYQNYENLFIFGYNANTRNNFNIFSGTSKGMVSGSFVGLTKNINKIRLGFIYSDNYSKTSNEVRLFGNSFAAIEFKTVSTFLERSVVISNLILNFGISYDKVFIDEFRESGSFQNIHFDSAEETSQDLFVDIKYPFNFFGLNGSIDLSSSKRKFFSPMDLKSKENFNFFTRPKKNYFNGEINLFRGPFFLSINHIEGQSPLYKLGFKFQSNYLY